MDEGIIKNMVRIGIVTDVDDEKRLVRVHFPDKQLTSGWLYLLKSPPTIENINDDDIKPWIPAVNDKVLCLYIPIFNGDGFVLGAL